MKFHLLIILVLTCFRRLASRLVTSVWSCALWPVHWRGFHVAFALLAMGIIAPTLEGATRYNIVALDALPGASDTLAFGLNDHGQIVGDSRGGGSTHIGQQRPVVWDETGRPTELWSDQEIGASLAGINNAGEIVGRYGSGSGIPLPTPGVPYGQALYWSSANGLQDVGFESFGNSQAVAINEAGQVVGTSERLELVEIEEGNFVDQFIPHPFIWDEAGGIRDLGTLGGYGGFATAINNLGQVVGHADLPSGYEGAFIWDEAGGMRQLESTPGYSSQAIAINDLGQVLGFDFGVGAVIWDPANGVETIPIGGLDINNVGQVLGGDAAGNLAIWDRMNGVQYLADLLPTNTSWQLGVLSAINDAGEIVGHRNLNGEYRGFLMTPVPEPTSLAIFICTALTLSKSRLN